MDGTDVKDINLVRLRYLVSIVSQEPILFGCSIKDNISYGLDTPLSMDEIITVARAANIHEFVSSLPQVFVDVIVFVLYTSFASGTFCHLLITFANRLTMW